MPLETFDTKLRTFFEDITFSDALFRRLLEFLDEKLN